MRFRTIDKNWRSELAWDCGPARVYIWDVHAPWDEEKHDKHNRPLRKFKMTVHWGGLRSVAVLDTREEAEEKAKEILNDHIRKLQEAMEEE